MGCGQQGVGVGQEKNPDKIINFAHALTEHDGFNKSCFADNDNKKAISAMGKYGGWATTIHYACESLGVNVAIVTTPDNEHFDTLTQLAGYPLRLVVCEKPICSNLQQAREIVELYKAKGIPLMVNYTRRFLPYYDYLKQYGKPNYAQCTYNRGLLHTGSHGIDFFNMIGADNFSLIAYPKEDYRMWDMKVFYENHAFRELRIGEDPVWNYYDKSHMHIINNAYEFLEGREEIKCTGEMALDSLEKCYELMEGEK